MLTTKAPSLLTFALLQFFNARRTAMLALQSNRLNDAEDLTTKIGKRLASKPDISKREGEATHWEVVLQELSLQASLKVRRMHASRINRGYLRYTYRHDAPRSSASLVPSNAR